MQRTLKTSKKKNKKKNVSRPRMDEKKLHTWEFQLKGILRNMKYKLLPKKFYWKNSRVFQMLAIYFHWKDIFTELNRYIFQISLKYIKLVIPKILCILVLCSFDFYFKIAWPPPPPSNKHTPPPNNITPHTKIKILDPPPPAKTFLRFLIPSFPHPPSWRGGCMPWLMVIS